MDLKVDSSKIIKKDTLIDGGKGIIIQPRSQSQCQKVVEYFVFDHYEAASGKVIGIWAEDDTYSQNTYKLDVYHDTLGYNYIFTHEGYLNTVISAGFDRDHVLLGGLSCDYQYTEQLVQNTKPVWAYYLDEQGQKFTCQPLESWFHDFRYYLDNNGCSGIKIITGESAPDEFDCYDQYVNTIMCTKYCLDLEAICYFYDQRGRWTDFRNSWGSKFNMTWISSRLDNEEFDNLIGHAYNLGLDGVWLFQADDTQASAETERSRIETFSLYAWKWGFLRRVERKWVFSYECRNQDPCDCDPYHIDGNWILVDSYPTQETRYATY